MASDDAIHVNRAPQLTLGRGVAGYSAQAKARRLGLVDERDPAGVA